MTAVAEPLVVGAVLMGGASRRFGSDKARADADGVALGRRVIDSLRDAGLDPVVAVGGDAGSSLGVITVPDRRPGAGPLAALASVLGWAGVGGVLVVPCDHPNLAPDDIRGLVDAFRKAPDQPAVGTVDGAPQVSVACWPAALARDVQRLVDDGEARFQAALGIGAWNGVEISGQSARDADTPAALRAALDGDESRG